MEIAKYSTAPRHRFQSFVDSSAALDLPPSAFATATHSALHDLVRASVANSTWRKYESGWRCFCAFEDDHEFSAAWPVTAETARAFAVWCVYHRRLLPATVRAYLSALRFAHVVKGLSTDGLLSDSLLDVILAGARNIMLSSTPVASTRRVVTFPLLLVLGHRIASTSWDSLSKQVVWAACTVAFFSSARLGELLPSHDWKHDPTSTLLWSDVNFTDGSSILIHLKLPKSAVHQGEFLDVFPFLGYNCCPVLALRSLWSKQRLAGVAALDMPVFRFSSGKNLTPIHFNSLLVELLPDLCTPGVNTISCHSFRAGIPTTLSLFPDIASTDDIKHWGRWNSDCYNRYTRLRHDQKEKIFGKISTALRRVAPPSLF